MTATPRSTDQVIDLLRDSWTTDQPLSAESLLQRYPVFAENPSTAVDIIYAEVLLLEESGQRTEESEYLQRFPQYADPLARQFQLHRALRDFDEPAMDGVSTVEPAQTVPNPKRGAGELPDVDLPGFRLVELAGYGGSGSVYKALDLALNRDVAIKLLHSAGPENDRQLLREAEAAASLSHEHIARIFQVGEFQGAPFLVMEFIDGETLSGRLQQGPLQVEKAVEMMIDVASAIHYAHKQGVIHRDLKPGNVLIGEDSVSKVCDFGLARKVDSEFTLHATGSVVGTPAYMAPEQARGDAVDELADVYSLGATLYHVLTGRPPFQAASQWEVLNQVMADDPVSVRDLNGAIPRDLDTICSRALHKNAGRRFPNAAEFAAELSRFQSGQPILSRPVGPIERAWAWCRRHSIASSLIGMSVVALTAVVVITVVSEKRVVAALRDTESALTKAETQRDIAFDAMSNLVHEVNADLSKHEASVEARRGVLESAIQGLQRLIEINGDQEDVRLTLVNARCLYAFILSQQGENEAAREEYLRAIGLCTGRDDVASRTELSFATSLLAQQCLRSADPAKAEEYARKAVEVTEELLKADPTSPRLRVLMGTACANLGNAMAGQERPEEGLVELMRAHEATREEVSDDPENKKAIANLVDIDTSIALVCFGLQRVTQAETHLREAIEMIETGGLSIEEDTQIARQYLRALRLFGVGCYSRMNYDEAIRVLKDTIYGYQDLISAEPERPGFRLQIAGSYGELAKCYTAMSRESEALEVVMKEVAEFEKGMELGGPEYRVQRYAIAMAWSQAADLQFRLGDLDESIKSTAEIVEVLTPLIEEYQLQSMIDQVRYHVEVLKAIATQPSSIEEDDVSRVRRSARVWRQLNSGDATLFVQESEQMVRDIEETGNDVLRLNLQLMYSLSRGLHYEVLSKSEATTPEVLEAASAATIEAIKATITIPGSDQTFYLMAPDFRVIRNTEEFRSALRLP